MWEMRKAATQVQRSIGRRNRKRNRNRNVAYRVRR